MKGQNDVKGAELYFTRINQSTINYRFKVENLDGSPTIEENGQADLLHTFFYASEMDFDERKGESYSSQEFHDRKTWTSVRVGKENEGWLRAKISSKELALKNCPTLSSNERDWGM